MNGMVGMALAMFATVASAAEWPVIKTYDGEYLRRIRMPVGGIGTGTISLSGRGSLVDWEINNHPDKGFTPRHGNWAPHFAIRCETTDGKKIARLLEGPLLSEEFEGEIGCRAPNQGFPRFAKSTFKAAYPLAQVELEDSAVPVEVRLEAMNPLIPGDSSASGIPAGLFRWCVKNPSANTVKVSIVGTLVNFGGVDLSIETPDGIGSVTTAHNVREPGWNVSLDRYWRKFLADGVVADSNPAEPNAVNVRQRCVSIAIAAGEKVEIPFAIGWRAPKRMAWTRYSSTNSEDVVGNFYATEYASAGEAAKRLLRELPALESKTIGFVKSVLGVDAPAVVKEAALFNISTLRTETCFRTADGHFFGWEGCYDHIGSCFGNCTHVWGYEHALVDLWPDLARDMLELQFGPQLDDRGHMTFRIGLPLKYARSRGTNAAADGQMQCIVKAYEYWKKSGDDAWLSKWYPSIRKALAFCWVEGGWDGDVDGVMEGCQHNTMDVEYFGPNPQMQFLYLAALEAMEAMANARKDVELAKKCGDLCANGKTWTEANLFNGSYYEHKIVPPKGKIAEGLRHGSMGARDLSNPDYQLGKGCLIDQLLGDYAARAVGLSPVADVEHAKITLKTILEKCRKAPDDDMLNNMRGYAMFGEESLRMAWYPEGQMPRSPFPYYIETMTGFEYVVAALLAQTGDYAAAERVVKNIRDRYDGAKRSPFDEAECGHHYARALDAWTVLKSWKK